MRRFNWSLIFLVSFFCCSPLFAQKTGNRNVKTSKYVLRDADNSAASDTTLAMATPDSTGNDTTRVYPLWPRNSFHINTSSSGTPDYDLVIQIAPLKEDHGVNDVVGGSWVTISTTNVSAAGAIWIILAPDTTPHPPAVYRIITDGQDTNATDVTAVITAQLMNPEK